MKNLLYFSFIVSTISCSTLTTAPNSFSLETFADSLLTVHVDSGKIAGASVIAFQNGEMLLDKSYGYASLELSVPIPLASFCFEEGRRVTVIVKINMVNI